MAIAQLPGSQPLQHKQPTKYAIHNSGIKPKYDVVSVEVRENPTTPETKKYSRNDFERTLSEIESKTRSHGRSFVLGFPKLNVDNRF